MSKILVLGGHGFVGTNLCKSLRVTRHQVFPVSRKNGVDLKDFSSTRKCFLKIKPNAIINCAASVGSVHYVSAHQADIVNDNMLINLNCYKAAAQVCPGARIVNPIANCAYLAAAKVFREADLFKNDVHQSVYSYGHAKRMLYVLAYCYNKQYQIRSVNFLVPNLFGHGDRTDPNKVHAMDGLIIRMIQSKKRMDKEFEIWGSGKPVREWGYIDDLTRVLIMGLTIKEDLIYPINFAQNKGYSIEESARIIARMLNYQVRFVFNTKFQDGVPVKIMDDLKFRQLFPKFKFTDHEKAIGKTVKYYFSILGKKN